MDRLSEWRIAADTNDRLGESVLWHPDEQALYWIDLYGPGIRRLELPSQRITTWQIPDATTVGSIAFASNGRLLVATGRDIRIFDPARETYTPFANPDGRADAPYNDGKIDRHGQYWIGTYDEREGEPRGVLYRIDRRGVARIGDSGFTVCNGPAFSPGGEILYFSDTLGRRILAYDVDSGTGDLSGRRLFAVFSENAGLPDGVTVDSAGHLWCAQYGAGQIGRFSPDGTLVERLSVPSPNVTSCCLGGPDLSTLYVTTGRSDGSDDGGGSLFARAVSCPGLPEPIFEPLPGAQP